MKRILILLLAALLLAVPALGESGDGTLGDMRVVNCEEWVSLRAEPDTASARLIEVPLGDTVYDCQAWDDKFIRCEYEGLTGYILGEYLIPANRTLDETVGGVHVIAERVFGEGETLKIRAENEAGETLWTHSAYKSYFTELDGTAAFIGGTAEDPRVIVYDEKGLASLRLETGEQVWILPVDLGGSISSAVAEDGTMYIGGYYGPDPIAFTMDGVILWRAQGNDDLYWLYKIEIGDEGIIATYDHIAGDREGTVCYGDDGALLWMK